MVKLLTSRKTVMIFSYLPSLRYPTSSRATRFYYSFEWRYIEVVCHEFYHMITNIPSHMLFYLLRVPVWSKLFAMFGTYILLIRYIDGQWLFSVISINRNAYSLPKFREKHWHKVILHTVKWVKSQINNTYFYFLFWIYL